MAQIKLIPTSKNGVYFSLVCNNDYFATSTSIAEFLNLPVETYNQLLIKEVIRHDCYKVNKNKDSVFYEDVTFEAKENYVIYIDHFKETFVPQLALLALGGDL